MKKKFSLEEEVQVLRDCMVYLINGVKGGASIDEKNLEYWKDRLSQLGSYSYALESSVKYYKTGQVDSKERVKKKVVKKKVMGSGIEDKLEW